VPGSPCHSCWWPCPSVSRSFSPVDATCGDRVMGVVVARSRHGPIVDKSDKRQIRASS
jgi:hypothetical protein